MAGIGEVVTMVPGVAPLSVPSVTGAANEPVASLNWAVKTLAASKVPVAVNGTEMPVCPWQKGDPLMVPVVMELEIAGDKTKLEV